MNWRGRWYKLPPMSSETKTHEQKTRRYLRQMRDIRPSATDERTFYTALSELLNAVGGELKPKVTAKLLPSGSKEGEPDLGLYSAEQNKRGKKSPKLPPEKPARGVVEVKGLAANMDKLLHSKQVGKYLDGYGLVLITNYRQFALVQRDHSGNPVPLESCELANSKDEFWSGVDSIPKERGPLLCEFLRRAMTRNAPILKAEDVANLLASYAREAAAKLQNQNPAALAPFRQALETSLGMKFEGENGDHFFRSTLVQTIFYGIFSAWMESPPDKNFDWKSAGFALKNPVMRELFSEIAKPTIIGKMEIEEQLNNATAGLNRVENKAKIFGDMGGAFEAIQHFYEPFLAAFDPDLRKKLGVWYTPPEIVRYMTRRVDQALKTELGLKDGLADKNVRVLDPCGGTGAYLVETLRVVRETLENRGDGKAMAAREMKRAAMERVFGFEILPASFVVAHWQIGAMLSEAGAPLKNNERVRVYLTNSLTGWESDPQVQIAFPELAEERAAAGKVKRDEPILVVIGNPPYNAFAGTASEEEGDLVAPYKKGLREKWGIKNFNLDDLFVRFFRIAENRIVKTGRGVVCYISNNSYVEKSSFVVMRESLLRNFNRIWIDNMNGDSRATGKKTPDGNPDPSVFSTDMNKAGIQVGTAVGTFVRTSDSPSPAVVGYRDFWGVNKRADLEASLKTENPEHKAPAPKQHDRFALCPMKVRDNYLGWPALPEFFAAPEFNGMLEMRGGMMIDFDREPLENRMRKYFNPDIDWGEYQAQGGGLAKNAARFNAQAARTKALKAGFDSENILRYGIRPFDFGYCYHTDMRPLWGEPRPTFRTHSQPENCFLLSRKSGTVAQEGAPMFMTRCVGDYDMLRGHAKFFPLRLWSGEMGERKHSPNLSESGGAYLRGLGCSDLEGGLEDLMFHALAIGYSRLYRLENADGLRVDWPRVPLPRDLEGLRRSASLGRRAGALLDCGVDFEDGRFNGLGVLRPDDMTGRGLGAVSGWGHRDGQGKVFPGSGLVARRAWGADELRGFGEGERELLGGALDVYLSGRVGGGVYWGGVPESAWGFRIGGYQVLKKWLSYRERSVLGRDLRDGEVLHFTGMVRRLSALVLLGDELDANYKAARDSAGRGGK